MVNLTWQQSLCHQKNNSILQIYLLGQRTKTPIWTIKNRTASKNWKNCWLTLRKTPRHRLSCLTALQQRRKMDLTSFSFKSFCSFGIPKAPIRGDIIIHQERAAPSQTSGGRLWDSGNLELEPYSWTQMQFFLKTPKNIGVEEQVGVQMWDTM